MAETPTMDQVREAWIVGRAMGGYVGLEAGAKEFDAMLAERDRQEREKQREADAAICDRLYAGTDGSDLERAWIGGVKAAAAAIRGAASNDVTQFAVGLRDGPHGMLVPIKEEPTSSRAGASDG